MEKEEIIEKYKENKEKLSFLKPRYLEMFELRHGLRDGKKRTWREMGEHYGLSRTRPSQLVARVEYEVERLEV